MLSILNELYDDLINDIGHSVWASGVCYCIKSLECDTQKIEIWKNQLQLDIKDTMTHSKEYYEIVDLISSAEWVIGELTV